MKYLASLLLLGLLTGCEGFEPYWKQTSRCVIPDDEITVRLVHELSAPERVFIDCKRNYAVILIRQDIANLYSTQCLEYHGRMHAKGYDHPSNKSDCSLRN